MFLVFSACPWLEMTVSLTYPGDRGRDDEGGWRGMGCPARVDGSSQWARGPFFGVFLVDVSANVCAIGVLVEIVA